VQKSTFNRPDEDIPFEVRRPHRRTGRRPGPPLGSQNNFKHGLRSKAFIERRRAFAMLMKACRAALEQV
jgi:hypothetical protein